MFIGILLLLVLRNTYNVYIFVWCFLIIILIKIKWKKASKIIKLEIISISQNTKTMQKLNKQFKKNYQENNYRVRLIRQILTNNTLFKRFFFYDRSKEETLVLSALGSLGARGRNRLQPSVREGSACSQNPRANWWTFMLPMVEGWMLERVRLLYSQMNES